MKNYSTRQLNASITLAIKALEAEIQKISINANLADIYNATFPNAVNSSKKRKRLRQAINDLTQLKEQTNEPPILRKL
ncbi:hypothetical protein ACFLZW_05690 [Chloroflexota bacterium]